VRQPDAGDDGPVGHRGIAGAPAPDVRDIRRRVIAEVSWATLFKIVAVAALVWLWLTLYQLVLVLIVAVLLAVTLDPVVARIERWRLPRWAAASIVGVVLLAAIGGFLYLTWSSLSSQASMVGARLQAFEASVAGRLPGPVQSAFGNEQGSGIESYLAPMAMRLIRAITSAVVVVALAFVLTIYLLIEGRRTYQWLLAFVPHRRRAKVHEMACESHRVIFGYVAGNVATSVFATIFVLVTLSVLDVPAALLLAVVAGICDFIPVVGFILSVMPALVLALSVSTKAAAIVLVCYLAYHGIENYLIAPYVYGDRLELSNLVVVLAFAVGAELAGVIGALIALPLAAAYPAVERIWLRDTVGGETVREHRAIERRSA
jgi:predicted PurR-regulated permease PerM